MKAFSQGASSDIKSKIVPNYTATFNNFNPVAQQFQIVGKKASGTNDSTVIH